MASWSDIPTEIKFMILEHCLIYRTKIHEVQHGRKYKDLLLKIALMDRETCILAHEIYYGKNEFYLEGSDADISDADFSELPFEYPHPTVAHWVRRMTLNLDPGHIRNGYRDSDWVCLVGAQSNWQSYFKLEKLDITVSPFPGDCLEPCSIVWPHCRRGQRS
jgi:hypothetical protein